MAINRTFDPVQLRKRMLIFYFAAGVNVLMALWVWSAGSTQSGGATLTTIAFVFLAFAGLNYYMARKIGRFLRQHSGLAPGPTSAGPTNNVNE